jgi:hypothetical protein
MKKLAAIGIAASLLAGCQPRTVGEAMRHLRGEEYVRRLEAGNHKLDFQLVPEALYLLATGDVDTTLEFSRSLMKELKAKEATGYGLLFTMTLAPKIDSLSPTDFRNDVVYGQITGAADYRKTLDEFLFNLKTKFWLEAGGRRFEMSTYHMSNSWGLSKSRSFTLVFPKLSDLLPDRSGTLALVVEDLVPGQGRNRVEWELPINGFDFSED